MWGEITLQEKVAGTPGECTMLPQESRLQVLRIMESYQGSIMSVFESRVQNVSGAENAQNTAIRVKRRKY